MLIQKSNPIGVDKVVDRLQVAIYNFLISTYSFTEYESYPRCYKNYKDGNVIPEMYNLNGNYSEVLFDDKFNLTSFFLVSDESDRENVDIVSQDVSIIFQGLLNKLFPAIAHRADEELKAAIYNALVACGQEDYLTSIETGVDKVYGDLRLLGDLENRVRLDDISNFNVIRFNLKVNYDIDPCNTSQL